MSQAPPTMSEQRHLGTERDASPVQSSQQRDSTAGKPGEQRRDGTPATRDRRGDAAGQSP